MVITLKHKKSITCTYALQKFLDKPIRKPNKTWVDKGSEVYNRSVKPWLQDKNKKYVQYITKENLLLLKDLLEP